MENNLQREIKEPVYICPICLEVFNEKAIYGDDSLLTLEHNPPQSLKGKANILTCKNCNNNHGSKSDALLLQRVIKDPFLKGELNSSIDAKFLINNFPIKGKLKILEKNKFLIHVKDASNPHRIDAITQYMKGSEGSLKLSFTAPKIPAVNKALLKIAYLKMFSLLGYCFVFDVNSSKLREAFTNNKDDTTPIFILKKDIDADVIGLNFIKSPKNVSNYLIIFSLIHKNAQNNIGVVIPTSGDQGWNNYLSLKGNFKLTFTHFEKYQGIIAYPEYIEDYYNIPQRIEKEVSSTE